MEIHEQDGTTNLVAIVVDSDSVRTFNITSLREYLPNDTDVVVHHANGGVLRTVSRVQRADHLLCSAVFFISEVADTLMTMYLYWANTCKGPLAKEQVKPLVFVTKTEGCPTPASFVSRCSGSENNGGRESNELLSGSFSGEINYVATCATQCVAQSIHAAVKRARRVRLARGHIWDRAQMELLRNAFLEHDAREPRAVFRMPSAFGPPAGVDSHRSLARVLACGVECAAARRSSVRLIASYLAEHTRRSSYWRLGPTQRSLDTTNDLPEHIGWHHYRVQYRKTVSAAWRLCRTTIPKKERRRLAAEVSRRWFECVHRAIPGPSGRTDTSMERHLRTLERQAPFLVQRDFGHFCAVCLLQEWDGLLPCDKHGLCNRCLQELDRHWRTSCAATISDCHICLRRFKDWKMTIRPPAAQGRVLSLDAGGARGLIQLKLLQMLESEIDLGVPLAHFFDLVIGTSIGGIVALGICSNQWSVEDCSEQLAMMAQNVFSVASPVGKMLSKITRGWSANLVKAAKIWLQGGIYGSKGIQTALQACFGSGKLLVAPIQPQTHVAVTTTIGEDPPCRLLTSYVRTNPERRYGRWDRPRDVRVWEAARATSAAPLYFSGLRLANKLLFDGAVYHMNPSGIGRREVAMWYGGSQSESLTVSVGCGTTCLPASGAGVVDMLCDAFARKTSPASEEMERALWSETDRNYERIDPALASQPIAMDNIDSVLSLLQNANNIFVDYATLRRDLASCAWRIVAATFFCDRAHALQHAVDCSTSLPLAVYHRLGTAIDRLYALHPDMHFEIRFDSTGVLRSASQPDLPWGFSTTSVHGQRTVLVDVKLVSGRRSASISGFPTKVEDLQHRLNFVAGSTAWSRKRKRSE